MKSRIITACLLACLLSTMCILENGMVNSQPKEQATTNFSSIYILAGEFRTVFANLLWIKVDQYHHEYIERNPNWAQNKDLLGLLKLITTLDPHFIEAYSTGAVIYSRGLNDKYKAAQYLEEGLRNNPKAWDLHRIAVLLYARHFNDLTSAHIHSQLALRYCDDDLSIPIMRRQLRTVERMIKEQQSALRQP